MLSRSASALRSPVPECPTAFRHGSCNECSPGRAAFWAACRSKSHRCGGLSKPRIGFRDAQFQSSCRYPMTSPVAGPTAGHTATRARNRSPARPQTPLATCRARPDLACACSLHSEGQSEARFIKVRAIPVRKTSSSYWRCLTRQSHAEEPVALLSNLQLEYLVVSVCSTVPLYMHAEVLRLPQRPRR